MLWNIKRTICAMCLLGVFQISAVYAQNTIKKIVVFNEGTTSYEIENLIADWENTGISVLMPLPFINGVVLQASDDSSATHLLDSPIINMVQDDLTLDLLTIRGMGEGGAGEGGAGEEPPASAIQSYDKPVRLGDRPWGVLDLYDSGYDPSQFMDYEELLAVPLRVRTAQLSVNRIKIAVFDTGIDFYHNRLNHLVKGGIDLVDFTPGLPMDENGHGTHIAGTLAAWEFGVAPEADLYAVKILDENAMGDLSNLIMGLQWALNHDIDVVNMSIGFRSDNPLVRKAIENAHAAGLIMVAAVGNHSNWEDDDVASGEGGAGEGGAGEGGAGEGGAGEGGAGEGGAGEGGAGEGGAGEGGAGEGGASCSELDATGEGGAGEGGAGEGGAGEGGAGEGGASTDCGTKQPYSVMYPAAYPQVIAVSAVDSYEMPAWFSNTGPETDVFAPGVNVVSTNLYDGFGIANGTSMATPHVTGAVALMLALADLEGVDLDTDQIKHILRDTALNDIIDLTAALNQIHAESLTGNLTVTIDNSTTNIAEGVSGLLNW